MLVSEGRLEVRYWPESDILTIDTGTPHVGCASLDWPDEVVVDLATEDKYSKVVGVEVRGATAWLPLGKMGYDQEADTLMLGKKEGATVVVAHGHLVAYWKPDPDDFDGKFYIPLGIEVLSARKWLGSLAV